MRNLKIRAYQTKDKCKVVEIFKSNVPKYFAESELEDLKCYLGNQIEVYFVAEMNDEIIGAGGINFEDEKKTGIISWDFIHPNHQGKGIGSKLLQHRLELLKSMQNIDTINVRTSQLTFMFYEKNGFVLNKIQKDYWAKGYDLYEMNFQIRNYPIVVGQRL
ncbi:GNAT family N-acetyltransferase [Brumimicrobium oceani]|uniref:GNAT family N-acetyltransferase n=1 Tax=Brumimicrobium oceani TaxID=2100725 RepID=A0A2U2XG45_9FLAO|nr:GNAT family N-acetyltransferase [Brumimicrobium oceani]PWH86727.1 GNAT family N-acetyltransferase [Brumimicrobium oceani]